MSGSLPFCLANANAGGSELFPRHRRLHTCARLVNIIAVNGQPTPSLSANIDTGNDSFLSCAIQSLLAVQPDDLARTRLPL